MQPRSDERPRSAAAGERPAVEQARDETARVVGRSQELKRRIQTVAEALPTVEEWAIAIVDDALDALGASTGLALRIESGGALSLAGAVHVPGDVTAALQHVPLDAPMPVADVARTGRPCYCESRAQLLARYPAMRDTVERLNLHALAVAPVYHLARLQGVVAFGFTTPRQLTSGEKAMLRALGNRYARALHAAHRFYEESDARAAEAAARRTAEEARAFAEAGARAQGDFLAVVSHELRTPLQAILGHADLLAEGIGGELPAPQRDSVMRIAAAGRSLIQIVENLLGFSAAQIGRQSVERVPFDVRDTIADVVALAQPLAARKALVLRAELPVDPVPMLSDRHKLQQIATNLVGNGVKFTERGEVVARIDTVEPGRVRLEVRDTGVGIAADDVDHLFEPFWQGARRAAAHGTGLGLSIVRQLARLLGGDVTVASTPGAGSTFVVEVPASLPAAER